MCYSTHMSWLERNKQQAPLLTEEQKPTALQQAVEAQMQTLLQKEPLTQDALHQHLLEKYPTPTIPERKEKWHDHLPVVATVRSIRGIRESAGRTIRSVDNMLGRTKDEALGLLDRGVFDLADKMVVAAKAEPEGAMAKVVTHLLNTWEEQEQYATEMAIYTKYKTRGMQKPHKPSHPLESLEALAAEGVIFRTIEDHLGNLIQIHVSKSPAINQLIESGIDFGAGKVIDMLRRRATEQLVIYTAVAAAKEDPEEMQKRLARVTEHAYAALEQSSYPQQLQRQRRSSK